MSPHLRFICYGKSPAESSTSVLVLWAEQAAIAAMFFMLGGFAHSVTHCISLFHTTRDTSMVILRMHKSFYSGELNLLRLALPTCVITCFIQPHLNAEYSGA